MNEFPKHPRIAVVGSGAVGGYYGAKLARQGHDVHFLLRSDLEHVGEKGMVIESTRGDFSLPAVQCAGTTEEIGPCDLVLIAIKATANGALDALIPPLLHGRTALLTLQNGLGNEEFLAERFGAERVMGGLCFTCINKTGPGKIVHLGEGRISIGEMGGSATGRTWRICDIFRESDIECAAKDDLSRERWKKLVWNIPFNGLSIAEGGIDVGRILANPESEKTVRLLMRETLDAAAKLGHQLRDSLIEQQIAVSLAMGDYKPSSLLDYLAGRAVEVDAIWGEPLRRAKAVGAEVPVLETLHRRLLELCPDGQ